MGKKADTFYGDSLTHELVEAVNNDFGRAVLRLPNQGRGEVRDGLRLFLRCSNAASKCHVYKARHRRHRCAA